MRTKAFAAALRAIFLSLLSLSAIGQEGRVQSSAVVWQPSEFRSHETTWVRRDESGNISGSFTEIQTGLNRQLEDGSWTRSSDEMGIYAPSSRLANRQNPIEPACPILMKPLPVLDMNRRTELFVRCVSLIINVLQV
jgi:hypothetical protein